MYRPRRGRGAALAALFAVVIASLPAALAQAMPPVAGCCAGMMGKMPATALMPPTPSSELPGFPGVSQLHHVGATGFFLDYSVALKLSTDQRAALNQIKQKSMAGMATTLRGIEQAEQELFALTASNQPDSAAISIKVQDIEKLRSRQRINFIRAVGEAVKVLSHDQHRAVLGTAGSDQSTKSP